MPDTAQQTGFNDPFVMPVKAVGDGWTGTAGPSKFFQNLIGRDTDARLDEMRLYNDREYERQSINSARAWEEYMDSTQYQRRVQDLEKAGLNPWLAVQNGISGSGSASADTGGTAQHQTSSGQSSNGLIQLISSIVKLVGMVLAE